MGFTGNVSAVEYKTVDGFTKGSIEINGTDEHHGQQYRILVKNENLASWIDGEVAATIPDLICVLARGSGDPVTNPNAYVGQAVAVVLIPAPVEFKTPKAISVFGPSYAGLDVEYQPV